MNSCWRAALTRSARPKAGRISTCSHSLPRKPRATASRSKAGLCSSAATAPCYGGWSATCWTTRAVMRRIPAPTSGCWRTQNGAVLSVRDHGAGIPESDHEKIFEPFYRRPDSSDAARGSGLGLALVRQIARTHGGVVACERADGGGMVFTVRLPRDLAGDE